MDDHAFGQAELNVRSCTEDGATVVDVAGELDVMTVGRLRAEFDPLGLDDGGAIRIDLSGLHFLDSSGMGVLASTCRRVRESGGIFSIFCPEGQARRVLEIAGLVDYLGLNERETHTSSV